MTGSEPYPVREWLPLVMYGDAEAKVNQHIINEMMAHPAELITSVELRKIADVDDEISADSIDHHLNILSEAGLITPVEGDEYTFYGYTDAGKQFIVDTQMYRGEEILKSVYHAIDKDDEFERAYRAERPDHPPATDEYEERETDREAWNEAREETFAELTIAVERIGAEEFEAEVVLDGEEVLDHRTITVENADSQRWDGERREQSVREPRGELNDLDAYGVYVEEDEDSGMVYVNVGKGGDDWYADTIIRRDIPIFRKRDGEW